MHEKRRIGLLVTFLVLSGNLGQAGAALLADTTFSHDRGFYAAPLEVTISTETAEAGIKYTLDGSDPRTSANATIGSNPCKVTVDPAGTYGRTATPAVTLRACAFYGGKAISNVDTQTYIFLADVIDQGEIKPGGSDVFWTTSMDPTVTRDPAYESVMPEAMLSIPTVSAVLDWEDLFGTAGIHRGNNLAKADYEKPCSLELIYPDRPHFAGFEGFQVDCGIRIQGGGGRWDKGLYDHKQSFGLRFRRQYGTGTLDYPVFESAPFQAEGEAGKYDSLILRAGHNKSWGATWDNVHTVYTRDQYGRDLQLAMSQIGSRGTFVHLYLNGIYWGLYNLCERPDHAFSASYLEGTEEDYYSGKRKGGSISGDGTRFEFWRSSVSRTTDFDYLQQYLAVDAYIDMALLGVFANPGDYPQYYFGNGNNPAGPIYFYQWDLEDSLGGGSRRSGNPSKSRLGSCYEFNNMWNSNAEFRMRVADRAYIACYNHGVFATEESTSRWLGICDYIYLAIVGESARWGDERYGDPGSRNWGGDKYHDLDAVYTRDGYWSSARDAVTADLQGREELTISQLRSGAYYPSINPPVFTHVRTTIDVLRKQVQAGYGVTIKRDGSVGTIYYTTDGSDPRAPGGVAQGISGGSVVTIPVDATTNVKARTKSGSEWSALHGAVFFVEQDFSGLRITEIMYNPNPAEAMTGLSIESIVGNDRAGGHYDLANVELSANPPGALTESDEVVLAGARDPANNGVFAVHHVSGRNVILKEVLADEPRSPATADLLYDGERYEFIELKNAGTTPLNLSGIVFTEAVRYAFPDGTCLAPGEFALIVSHATSFADRYPGVSVCGDYSGHLANSGETLELSLATGEFFPVRRIEGHADGYGRLFFDEVPAGLAPGDRVRLERANHVSNNGMHRIAVIEGGQIDVTHLLADEGTGAKATFFRVVTAVTYDDKAPWPQSPDGDGYSLVPNADPGANPNDYDKWRASTHIHGSPGQDDPGLSPQPVVALSVRQLTTSVARNAEALPEQFEVWNGGQQVLDYEITDNVDWLSVSPVDGTSVGIMDKNHHVVSFETENLTGGIHEATINVFDPCALNSPETIDVRLEVLTPEIALSTASLMSHVSEGGKAPEQTFNVWNGGVGTLNYSVMSDVNWLSVLPDRGSSADVQNSQSHTVAFDSDRLALGEHHATITITDPNARNDPQTISVTLGVSETGAFLALNDLNSTNSINSRYVTEYDYSAANERLRDVITGEDLFVTVTGSVSPAGAYDPYGSNGGNFANADSDAYEMFGGLVDLTGVFELDAPNWNHILTFNNLEPNRKYTITLTANRDSSSYRDQRFTRVTIGGAESYRNTSSAGVVVYSEASVSFSTGYNTINGFVAQWTDISPGPDGSFSIRSAWDDDYPGAKGYAMSAFRLESQ